MLSTQQAVIGDLSSIQALADAQTARFHALDSRLPTSIALPAWILMPSGGACWLLRDDGALVGALCAERERWPAESPFSNVFPRRYLRLRLMLEDGVDPGAGLAMLLAEVDRWPGAVGSGGRMLLLPSCDEALQRALWQAGFAPYHAVAHQPMPVSMTNDLPPDVAVRVAEDGDSPQIAAMMADSWRFHAAHQPAITLSPQIEAGCERQAQILLGDGLSQATLVAVRGDDVVGFFAIGISAQEARTRPTMFARGFYGDIYEVCVREDQRRAGIGRAMYAEAWRWFRRHYVAGMFVNYAPTNPISSHFWPRLGFRDAWINWWQP